MKNLAGLHILNREDVIDGVLAPALHMDGESSETHLHAHHRALSVFRESYYACVSRGLVVCHLKLSGYIGR